MKAVLFGATGMVGQGVLRECLLDPRVERVMTIGRASIGKQDPKLVDLVHADLYDYSAVKEQLEGWDVCFFCLGVSSAGMSEEAYTKVTCELTVAAAKALLEQNPLMQFMFLSGAGTDSTEKGRSMWARVKGRAEKAVMAMPFKASYMFRPGLIQPLHGIKSRTTSYRVLYALMAPFMPLMRMSGAATTTERMGKAMINVTEKGYEKRILGGADINKVALG